VVDRLGLYAPIGLLGYHDAEIAPALHGNLVLSGDARGARRVAH